MIEEHGIINKPITIREDYNIVGLALEDIVVEKEVLIINGTCVKNITINKEGKAIVHGVVSGNIFNQGGDLEVFGIVQGNIETKGGETKIHEGAIVKGHIKLYKNKSKVLAATIGGAVLGNLFLPGFGGAITGGLIGALLGNKSEEDEKND